MTYTTPRMCAGCGNPESLCDDTLVCAFLKAHVYEHDGHRASISLDTLRVLVQRAQAWGQEQSEKSLRPEGAVIVPAEPTQEMIDAGANTINRKLDDGKQAALVYRHMIAAKP